MPAPRFRSRSAKRKAIKTPGGKSKTHYKPKKVKTAHCANCGKPLAGVPRLRAAGMRKLPKTKKRPERVFGGVLCSNCVKEKIKSIILGE